MQGINAIGESRTPRRVGAVGTESFDGVANRLARNACLGVALLTADPR